MADLVKIMRAPDDPVCPARVSCGGGDTVGGYYVVYRGDLDACVKATEAALIALRKLQELPPPARPKVNAAFKSIENRYESSSS